MSTGGTHYTDGVPEGLRPRPKPANHNVRPSNPDSMASYYSER